MRTVIIAAALFVILLSGGPAAAQQALQPDTCGAAVLQSFVGKPKTKLPVNLKTGTRVLCDTCAATMDYSPARLNVIYDEKTGIVTKIRCG